MNHFSFKIISHRGNISVSNPSLENNPKFIQESLDFGFDAEIDIWFLYGNFYLGHDSPQHLVDYSWLKQRSEKLWCHAKNFDAIIQMNRYSDLNYFWHENDKMTLTSKNIPWLYPNNFCPMGITVLLEPPTKSIPEKTIGICTDYPIMWKKFLEMTK
jgi:hypothetical protein